MGASAHDQSVSRRRQATTPAAPANPATTTAPSTKGRGDPADVLATADDGVTFRILGPDDDGPPLPVPVPVDGDWLPFETGPALGVVPSGEVVDRGASEVGVE
jgi:hypothetical protein